MPASTTGGSSGGGVQYYVTPERMKVLFPRIDLVELTARRDSSSREIDETILEACCSRATGVLAGRLARKFDLSASQPFPESVSMALEANAASVARFFLGRTNEAIEMAYRDAIDWANRIAEPDKNNDKTLGVSVAERSGSANSAAEYGPVNHEQSRHGLRSVDVGGLF